MPNTVSPLVSPDNFHVSLAGAFTGGPPLVPRHFPVAPMESFQMPSVEESGSEYVVSPETESGDLETSDQPPSSEESLAKAPSNGSSAGNTGFGPLRYEKTRKQDKRRKNAGHKSTDQTSSEEKSSSQEGQTTSSPEFNGENTRGRTRTRRDSRRKNRKRQHNRGNETSSESSANVETTEESTTENTTSDNFESSEQTDKESTDANTNAEDSSKENARKNAPGDSGWTLSEDCLLRNLKEGGETWAAIGGALNKGKKDIRARWNIIKDQPRPSDGDDTDPVAVSEDTGAESSPVAKTKKKSEGKKNNQPQNEAKGKSKASASTDNKWHKGVRNHKVGADNKQAKAQATQPDILSGEEASSEDSSTWGVFGYADRETRHQRRYLHDNIYKELYPPMIHPEPDEVFRQKDCEILATIDSKYKRSKWLEMQANFYNVTGRMVPIEAIRDRVLKAEEDEEKKKRERERKNKAKAKAKGKGEGEVEERLRKVEKWMKKVAAAKELDDPDS